MRKRFILGTLLTMTAGLATQAAEAEINWDHARKYHVELTKKGNEVSFSNTPIKSRIKIWYATAPWTPDYGEGISFEVMGDGSKYYASVFLGYNKWVHEGYEAIFPLDSKNWKKVTIPFRHFVRNDKPWGVRKPMNAGTIHLDPSKVNYLAFGRGFQFHKYYPEKSSFKIRHLSVVKKIPARQIKKFSRGLSRTKTFLRSGKKLKNSSARRLNH